MTKSELLVIIKQDHQNKVLHNKVPLSFQNHPMQDAG